MANCVTCKAKCENAGQHRVKTDCISYIPKNYPKPKTNSDRIRAMSDEELAAFFAPRGCPWIINEEPCPERGITCNKCWLDWLIKEADHA